MDDEGLIEEVLDYDASAGVVEDASSNYHQVTKCDESRE